MKIRKLLKLQFVIVAVIVGLGVTVIVNASRNSSGTYSLPSGNPVVSGTTISSTVHNSTMSDIATEITDSLSRSGKGPMLANLELVAGNDTCASPALTWSGDTDSGLARTAANDFSACVNGAEVLGINATGLAVTGTTLSGDGTVSLPGIGFSGDTDNGLYRIGANNVGMSIAGTKMVDFSSTTTTFTGTGAGHGVTATGGGTDGRGGSFVGGATNGVAVVGVGDGTGQGGNFTGGDSSGTGVDGRGGAPNGIGGYFEGAGTGVALLTHTGGLKIGLNGTAITHSAAAAFTIDFANTADGACSTSVQTLTGASASASVCVVSPVGATLGTTAGWVDCYPSASDQVTIRFCCANSGGYNPSNAVYEVRIFNR